ncbi:substrate-binding periplasmic protein [Pacificispira spongiicola]|nr:transporter substrate-binding domain-containing protein [Pacificispira spongiicola]
MKYMAALFCCIWFMASSWAAEPRPVTIATLDFPPYVSNRLPNKGWAWEVARTVLRQQGYEPNLLIMPWIRALKFAEEGEVDALFMANKTPEREKWAVFSDPIGEEVSVAFKLRDRQFGIRDLSDLATHTVVALRGSNAFDVLRRGGVEAVPVSEMLNGFQMVLQGRADMFVTDRFAGRAFLRQHFTDDLVNRINIEQHLVDVNRLHLAISKKVPDHMDILTAFNNGLAQARQNGLYDRIQKSHGF